MTDIQAFWVLFWLCAGWCGICAAVSYIYHRARAKVMAWVSGRRRKTEAERARDEMKIAIADKKQAFQNFNLAEPKFTDSGVLGINASLTRIGAISMSERRAG